MPRTTTLDTPGCPPLRALAFDSLGLIKVVECKGEEKGAAKMVEKWGQPDASSAVVAASILDREFNPLLAVARKNGSVDILTPVNGAIQASISNLSQTQDSPQDNAIVGLHLFKKPWSESSLRSYTFLTSTIKGCASIRSFELPESRAEIVSDVTQTTWSTSGSGETLFLKVDGSECYSLFGGKGVEVNVWDLLTSTKIWTAKSPAKNNLGIFTPTWFTSASFLSKDDHRKFVSGTHNHQVRLYDTSAQRRPVMSFDFRDTPIKAVSGDLDGQTIYVGNGSGDLASFDIRTGKLLGSFVGKCAGSIRSIVRHPELPVLASCGLDSYLRFWDINSRQLLSAVFLKQPLTDVVFDSYFGNKEVAPALDLQPQLECLSEISDGEEDMAPRKRKKTSKKHKESKKLKLSKTGMHGSGDVSEILDSSEENTLQDTRKKASKAHKRSDKLKSKRTKQ